MRIIRPIPGLPSLPKNKQTGNGAMTKEELKTDRRMVRIIAEMFSGGRKRIRSISAEQSANENRMQFGSRLKM
jgi:hypothetical protein